MTDKNEQIADCIKNEIDVAYDRGAAAAFATVVKNMKQWAKENEPFSAELDLDAAIEAIERSAKNLIGEQLYKDAMAVLEKRSEDK